MDQSVSEFFHDFRQMTLAEAEANSAYQLEAFMETVSNELIETGFIEGYEYCHYRSARGMRVDGYWFNDEGVLDLFVADFDCRRELETLTRSEVEATFKRVVNFFEGCLKSSLQPDVTTPEYGLIRQIVDRRSILRKVNFILTSERVLSDRFESYPDGKIEDIPTFFHIWDMSRFQRQRDSRSHKELLDIDFVERYGRGLDCLRANLEAETYQSFLIVMPATILSSLYDKHGARLLEQNVRTFLQARGAVNKGIRSTILGEPEMFFAYNNGITATAQKVETRKTEMGLQITRMVDLQIVNGGQTTASLFHTHRRDKADLSKIVVQMKLSVIDSEKSEKIVPCISEFANTQNRVNAADFFSNHPFHVRVAEFSRRIWAPAKSGAQRETKWFYERVRGQYADAQSKLTPAAQRNFRSEYPKDQLFTKTELAKFENVWDDHPKWVNLGSQKNFGCYAQRMAREWEKSSSDFNEVYFHKVVARAIIFRHAEKLVGRQAWYNGGYRANIVAYAIATLGECARRRSMSIPWQRIWKSQEVFSSLDSSLAIAAKFAYEQIMAPPEGISNISEWCKKDACWSRMRDRMEAFARTLPAAFFGDLVSIDEVVDDQRFGRKDQKIEDGIKSQIKVLEISALTWRKVLEEGNRRKLFSDKEQDIIRIATQLPNKIPTPKQCDVLVDLLRKLTDAGVMLVKI